MGVKILTPVKKKHKINCFKGQEVNVKQNPGVRYLIVMISNCKGKHKARRLSIELQISCFQYFYIP